MIRSIPRNARPLVLLVVVATVLVTVWSLVTAQVNEPAIDAGQSRWTAEFEDKGASSDFVVHFSMPKAAVLTPWGFDDVSCDTGDERTNCVAYAALGSETLRVGLEVAEGGDLIVDKVDTVRQTRRAPFDGRWFGRLFVLALLLQPIVWALHRRVAASQWLLIAMSSGALLALQPEFTIPLLGIIVGFYFLGRWYRQSDARSPRFILSWVLASVLLLLIFKNFKALFFLPFEEFGGLSLLLPLGTSYFLIRLIDLQLRWHRGQLEDLSLREYLVYLLFPGTLVAGPIELVDRFFAERLERITTNDVLDGLMRIAIGVAKKLVLVDLVLAGALFRSGLWSSVALDPWQSPEAVIAFCVLSYLLAYLDFSAYSDIAIGISRTYGYDISENFTWPVLASDLAEFWRRWHMSLSSWAFRNVFFPVMVSTKSRTLALVATLLLVGLWHDLSLSWVTWGLYHGFGLAILAKLPSKFAIGKTKLGIAGKVIATNVFVAAGFAFVSIRDYSLAWQVFLSFVSAPVRALVGLAA